MAHLDLHTGGLAHPLELNLVFFLNGGRCAEHSETAARRISGYHALVAFFLLCALDAFLVYGMIRDWSANALWTVIPVSIAAVVSVGGFFIVQPNTARVLVLFGRYIGSMRVSGFWWANPFAVKKHVSLRIRNFCSDRIKVNDLLGNPIEIAAVIVWHVVDSSRALFDVDHYEHFVAIQSETAIRTLASEFPYDSDDDNPSLRGNPQKIEEQLKRQVQRRLEIAGVEVTESRISHLAYAPEIAQLMLRRQQAQAIIAARQKLVEGAVGMVEHALRALSEQQIVELDQEKKATMVSNLLVALVSECQVQPVINTGTLYQ